MKASLLPALVHVLLLFTSSVLLLPSTAAFKLVIDCNTMSVDDLKKTSTGRLVANGSYCIFSNYNFSGTAAAPIPPPSDELWRSYLKGVGTELAFTENDPGTCQTPAPQAPDNLTCSCKKFRQLTGRPPTAAVGYWENLAVGSTLLTDAQIDAQAQACGAPVIVLTRTFCSTELTKLNCKSGPGSSNGWIDNTTRALKNKHVFGVAMEYTPVPEPGGACQGCGIVELMHVALAQNKSVMLLWPLYSNNRGKPAWQDVADAIAKFRSV
jgi:hypothetical protein